MVDSHDRCACIAVYRMPWCASHAMMCIACHDFPVSNAHRAVISYSTWHSAATLQRLTCTPKPSTPSLHPQAFDPRPTAKHRHRSQHQHQHSTPSRRPSIVIALSISIGLVFEGMSWGHTLSLCCPFLCCPLRCCPLLCCPSLRPLLVCVRCLRSAYMYVWNMRMARIAQNSLAGIIHRAPPVAIIGIAVWERLRA